MAVSTVEKDGLMLQHEWSRRAVLGVLATGAAAPMAVVAAEADDRSKLSDESLGTLLKAMGFETKLHEKRYDYAFKAVIDDNEWELSMSAVLSQDANSLWIMAWLDELPKSAADVPRTALLRLLADNDKLGKGKFFAYIASNRRFVLQRVIPNDNVTGASLRAALDDLGSTVVATHGHWSVSNWQSPTQEDPAAAQKSGAQVKGSAPQASTGKTRPVQSATRDVPAKQ
jgi:hypothetical protein